MPVQADPVKKIFLMNNAHTIPDMVHEFGTEQVNQKLCEKEESGYQSNVTSEIFSALGLLGLAFLPDFLPDPFIGIICSVIVYAIGSGLIEVLCSPIISCHGKKRKHSRSTCWKSF